jgi:hypothetical protein
MLARLLYAAVGLCVLGTRVEHAGTRVALPADAGPAALAAPARACPAGPPPGIGGTPGDFAIPRIQR